MQTYEINLWKDKRIIEKVVKQFEEDKDVLEFIKKNSIIITWSKITTYVRKKGPMRLELNEKENELKDTLEKSITQETINEWGYNEMLRHTRKAYGPNPDAKGYEEFPGRRNKTYDRK